MDEGFQGIDEAAGGVEITVKRLHPAAQVPRYAHTGPYGDLAADLYAVGPCRLAPGETASVATGIALGLPAGYGALVEDRSGLALKGVTTLAGVIDPGYRGEVRVVLTNLSAVMQEIAAGDRVAQLRVVRRIEARFVVMEEELDATERGGRGFGSTGV